MTITPEIIQAEIENLENIIPASDYHIILFPIPKEKTDSGLIKSQSMLLDDKIKNQKGYFTVVKPNPNIPEVKVGMGLLPRIDIQKGGTRQEGMVGQIAGTLLPYPLPKSKEVEYLLVHHTQVLAFQTND